MCSVGKLHGTEQFPQVVVHRQPDLVAVVVGYRAVVGQVIEVDNALSTALVWAVGRFAQWCCAFLCLSPAPTMPPSPCDVDDPLSGPRTEVA